MQRLGRTRLSLGLSLFPGMFALLSAYSCAQSDVSGPCAKGLTKCSLECADLQTNPDHCGSCDSACALGTACEAGACAGGCVKGFLDCGQGCIDPQTSSHDCGACGLACPAGTACTEGVCGLACPAGYAACDGTCFDLQSTTKHCGSCDVQCAVGAFCVEGVCQPCEAGMTLCGARCADLQTSPLHCGDCATRCAEHFTCVDGKCDDSCGPNQGFCNGACVNVQSNNENCGTCGTVCQPGFQCSGGICQSRCAAEQLFCAGQCIDAQTNSFHCGGCFQTCPLDFTCVDGACQNPCGDGLQPCGDVCADFANDSANCGGCFLTCGAGLACSAGACTCAGEAVCGLCSPHPLESRVPQTVTGTTVGGLNTYHPSCNSDSSEVPYSFTAPTNGTYTFSLAGSGFDTLLAVVSSTCGELACNDDGGGSSTSLLSLTLRSGQTVQVVVDGYSGATGNYTLTLSGGLACTTTDIGSTVPQTVNGTTAALQDVLTPSCGVAGGRDIKYTFTAPAAGTYTFDTAGSTTNTVLHVRDASCTGPELACNNDTGGGLQSEVTVTLTAGQVVVIVVDGAGPSAAATGPFILNIR